MRFPRSSLSPRFSSSVSRQHPLRLGLFAPRSAQQPFPSVPYSTRSSAVHSPLRRTGTPRRAPFATVLSMPVLPFLGSFFSSSTTPSSSETMDHPDKRSDREWQAVLSPEQFRVLREKGTEAPFTGAYDKHFADTGVYSCAGCHAPLYKATHKFKSGCGWPAYYDSLPGAVRRHEDRSLGMLRTEIVCANCGGHLGHVFKGEGYPTPTDERHCVNSISLTFSPEDEAAAAAAAGKTPADGGANSKA